MDVCPTVRPIPQSHGTLGHSMECPSVLPIDACVSYCLSHPTVPWDSMESPSVLPKDACVSYCPSHHTIPWDSWTFHEMSTSPPTDAHVSLFIPSHGPMGHSMECPQVPWDSGMGWTVGHTSICSGDRWTFHGMSHSPMGLWDGQ